MEKISYDIMQKCNKGSPQHLKSTIYISKFPLIIIRSYIAHTVADMTAKVNVLGSNPVKFPDFFFQIKYHRTFHEYLNENRIFNV